MSQDKNYDDMLATILINEKSILGFLSTIFGFLARRTDFYYIPDGPYENIGFPPGVAEDLVVKVLRACDPNGPKMPADLNNEIMCSTVAQEVEITDEENEIYDKTHCDHDYSSTRAQTSPKKSFGSSFLDQNLSTNVERTEEFIPQTYRDIQLPDTPEHSNDYSSGNLPSIAGETLDSNLPLSLSSTTHNISKEENVKSFMDQNLAPMSSLTINARETDVIEKKGPVEIGSKMSLNNAEVHQFTTDAKINSQDKSDNNKKPSCKDKTSETTNCVSNTKSRYTSNPGPPPSIPSQRSKSREAYNGADREKYSWSQNIMELDVTMTLPDNIKSSKDLKVTTNAGDISVARKNGEVIVSGILPWKIKVLDCFWSISEGKLLMHLEKVQERWWDRLFTSEEPINLNEIDCSRPLDELPQDHIDKVRELQWNQDRKMKGLPTSDEIRNIDILKKAWNAPGSPFLGQEFDPSVLSKNPINFPENSEK